MASTNLPLPVFYAQTLGALLPVFDDTLSPSDAKAQSILSDGLDNLHLIARMITSLGVFSDNESVEELGDGELAFMTLGWVFGEAESKSGLGGYQARKAALDRSQNAFNLFISLLASYKVLSPDERAESSAMAGEAGLPRDPAARREAKIKQYKREKELREQISSQLVDHPPASSTPLAFILSLLPSSSRPSATSALTGQTSVNEEKPDQRQVTFLLLRLLYTLTLSSLSSIKMELDILSEAPSVPQQAQGSSSTDARTEKAEAEENTWRLDRAPASQAKPRQLISGGGRVLRPFTILPSTTAMSERERLQGQVFRDSHRLPTMTIDEYLEEEQRRGNIITGGGKASEEAPTQSELLEIAAEMDGTQDAEDKGEQKRLKDENWARFTEENKKGAGNTMNRG